MFKIEGFQKFSPKTFDKTASEKRRIK